MANYSIILNLTGNSVERSAALATNLATANANAIALSASLANVSASAAAIPRRMPLSGSTRGAAVQNTQASALTAAANAQSAAAQRQATAAALSSRAAREQISATRYTRHRSTTIASYGTGFNLGGFSGRFSSILQPDAAGKIFGIDASKLTRGANIAAIATELIKKVGEVAIKTIAASTIVPPAVAAITLRSAIRILRSENFAEGVRLLSRRHQAALGLGDEYTQAIKNTDFLAATFGLDRSTALSSINTLTGLGVGGGDRRLTLDEATGLTKIAGLISQHHGVPFERVSTNIQQLLVQDKPHIRDIRELLNQAPILGKYALREIQEKGLNGVDIRTYLKDQKNILSVLKQYELDIASNAGMQARGRISLAQQDFWATIAQNEKFWSLVGREGSGVIGSAGQAVDSILKSLANNERFLIEIRNIQTILEKIANNSDKIISKVVDIAAFFSRSFGIGNRSEARTEIQRENAIEAAFRDPGLYDRIYEDWKAANLGASTTSEGLKREFDDYFKGLVEAAKQDSTLRSSVYGTGRIVAPDERRWYQFQTKLDDIVTNTGIYKDAISSAKPDTVFRYLPNIGSIKAPNSSYAAFNVPTLGAGEFSSGYLEEIRRIKGLNPEDFDSNGQGTGDDLTGNNRDRRSLIINFNAPLLQWANTVMTSEPERTVEQVRENIEEIISTGVQRAFLGVSNKVGTSSFY